MLTLGQIYDDFSLAELTSWRVGGPAKRLFVPKDRTQLQVFLQGLSLEEPLLWLGLGSNTLIRDGGFPGTVILTQLGLKTILQNGLSVTAEVGVPCAKMARFCARQGLAGSEFLAGIPGTLGGALRMNAGCFGGETWQWVQSVELINRQGEIKAFLPQDFKIAYREVVLPGEMWFLSGTFQFHFGDREKSLNIIRTLLDKRSQTQPTGDYSCGSVFRNPPGDYAARLIETAGLKGSRMGGAMVSPKHANFIVNSDNASAHDIEQLIAHVAHVVETTHGVKLIPEVHVVGNAP